MDEKEPIVQLDLSDNIVVARTAVAKGTTIIINGKTVNIRSDIPMGHKIAVKVIARGQPVIKSSTIIGYAKNDIMAGDHVHVHNIHFDEVHKEYEFCRDYKPTLLLPENKRRTFKGYLREDGTAGTRNFIAIPIVSNCAATVARKIAAHFTAEIMKEYPNVDGVIPLITSLGCGMSETGKSMKYLRRVIAGHINNPNFAGAVVCALGCERNDIDRFFEAEGLEEGPLLKKLTIQKYGSKAAVDEGIRMIKSMLPRVNQTSRTEVSAEYLKVALQCGGSDAFSCFSANPALGKAMDQLVQNGATAVLSETTELFGAEYTLTRRAKTPEIARKLLDKINWWLEYCKGHDVQINGGVTPGNTMGGITNILEKALGSVKKGGSTSLNAVYDYAEPIKEAGLVIMDAPSYDPVSATAQFAGGCNLCVFTTGRGSCYGSRYFPTIKIASNTELYLRMDDDMDINAGKAVDGDMDLETLGNEIFERIISAASGEKTKSELFGMGDEEYVPWAIGITS